jgi:hypothetical protein
LGVDLQFFSIGAIDEVDYYIKFYLCNKSDYFQWALVVVWVSSKRSTKKVSWLN